MTITSANPVEFEQAVALMTAAFIDDPVARYLYPDLQQYLQHFPDYARLFGEPGLDQGATHLLGSRGAAFWVPPDRHADPEAVEALLARSVSSEARAELTDVYAEFDRAHPVQPHWYLPLIAIDPFHRGKGGGAALLAHGLAMCDREGSPAYLESTKLENVPFYERFGFERLAMIDVGNHPKVTTMLRAPR